MKNTIYTILGITAMITTSCTNSEFDAYPAPNGGTANFTTYIAVGNSLTQGYQSGGLHNELQQQDNSYPAIIAGQMGTPFVQPTVDGEGSGHKFLQALGTSPTITDVAPDANWSATTGWSTWDKTKSYNNLGVAGIRLTDCVPTAGDPASPAFNQIITNANPFGGYLDFGASPFTPIPYLQHVKESKATFFTCWLGNNDVLSWATAGGADGEISIPGLGSTNLSGLTPVSIFRNKYDSILNTFKIMGAKGVCATLPDVTSIPFFTTVPYNPIPLDQATADQLNTGYAAYNGGLDQLAAAGAISTDEAAKRKITFTASSTNAIVIMDESLTDLTSINPALIAMRQTTAADLILLTASSEIGRELAPGNPATAYGVSVPFADSLVLTSVEILEVQNRTNSINSEINASAAAYGMTVVDMASFMVTLKSGLIFDGVTYNAKYIQGGAFSLDGVHPNNRGYAMIANKFIETINNAYGANLRPVAVQEYKGITFP